MIVDGHLDIAYNALESGRGFEGSPASGYLVSRETLRQAGVGLVFATVFTLPVAGRRMDPEATAFYRTAREANLMARLQLGYYRSIGLQVIKSRVELAEYRRSWRPGKIAALLLMENADPIESPAQVGWWSSQGVRIIGPAWMRTRYCGGTRAPGGLTAAGRSLLRAMRDQQIILDLSHMADRSMQESLRLWDGPVVASHAGARVLNKGQRQLPDSVIAEIGRRDGILGISFYSGHLRRSGKAGIDDLVGHAAHYARVSGDPRHVGIGSDLDGGFGKGQAAVNRLVDLSVLQKALRRQFSATEVDGIMGENWLRFLANSLPDTR